MGPGIGEVAEEIDEGAMEIGEATAAAGADPEMPEAPMELDPPEGQGTPLTPPAAAVTTTTGGAPQAGSVLSRCHAPGCQRSDPSLQTKTKIERSTNSTVTKISITLYF